MLWIYIMWSVATCLRSPSLTASLPCLLTRPGQSLFKGLDGGSVLPEAPQLEEKKEGDCTPHYEIYRSLDFIPQVWTSSAHVPSNRWDIRQTYVGNYKLFFFSLMVKIFLKKTRLDKFYSEILTAPPLHTL